MISVLKLPVKTGEFVYIVVDKIESFGASPMGGSWISCSGGGGDVYEVDERPEVILDFITSK